MKNRKLVSLCGIGIALSLTGCFGNSEKEAEPAPVPAPLTLEVKETKRDVNNEIKELVPSDDEETNKALILGDDLLLVTYGTKDCIAKPDAVKLTDGNTLLVEMPENKPLLACKGEKAAQGWDIEVPEKRAKDIKSAQLTFPGGRSGGISVYGENLSPDVPKDVDMDADSPKK